MSKQASNSVNNAESPHWHEDARLLDLEMLRWRMNSLVGLFNPLLRVVDAAFAIGVLYLLIQVFPLPEMPVALEEDMRSTLFFISLLIVGLYHTSLVSLRLSGMTAPESFQRLQRFLNFFSLRRAYWLSVAKNNAMQRQYIEEYVDAHPEGALRILHGLKTTYPKLESHTTPIIDTVVDGGYTLRDQIALPGLDATTAELHRSGQNASHLSWLLAIAKRAESGDKLEFLSDTPQASN